MGFIQQFAHARVNAKYIVKDVALVCELLAGVITTNDKVHVFRRHEGNSFIKVGEIHKFTLKLLGKLETSVCSGDIFSLNMDNATSGFRGGVAMDDYLVTEVKW
jgi:hypothetical protein